MTFRRLRKGASAPESPRGAPPPQQQYAPPPGPPPGWETAFGVDPDAIRRARTQGSSSRRNDAGTAEHRARILSHDEEIQRLFKVCEAAKGSAQLLRETVAYTKPEELTGNELIQEFQKKCRQSHKYITTTIPWATVEAEQSRTRASGHAETPEETLLAQLLAANEEVVEALKVHQESVKGVAAQEERNKEKAKVKLRAFDAITRFEPTALESSIVDRILQIGDPHGRGSVSVHAAHKILGGSGLRPETLSSIYDIANVEENEMFSKHCIGVAVRLIGYAQAGVPIEEELVTKAGPFASIDGLEPPRPDSAHNVAGPSTSGPLPSPNSHFANLPPLTLEDRQKFIKIFNNNEPDDGVINGTRARELFMKSRLPSDTLSKIWELADTHKCGVLDVPSFIIAMYLIQALMVGTLNSVPPILPPQLYSEAALAASTANFDKQFASEPSTPSHPRSPAWDVPPDVRSSAHAFFEAFDEQQQGYLSRDVIQAHLKQTGLPSEQLQHIWHLSDMDSNGRLSRDEFAVALYLVHMAERRKPLPARLPNTLVPPGRRPPPSVPTVEAITSDLIGLDFSDGSVSHPPGLGRPITPASSPPPLPPRSPMSPSTASIFQPHYRSASSSLSRSVAPSSDVPMGWTWDVSPAEKASSDKFFETLDPWKHGYIEGDTAVTFMSKSKLSHEDLGQIWDLANIHKNGRLTKEEFAVAMYLIRAKLAGREIPETLPTSLIPPANLPALPDDNAVSAATSVPGPPLPRRPVVGSGSISSPQESAATAQATRDETVSPQRAATPPPPYEEPNVANIAGA